MATAFLCPLEVIKVRLQTDPIAARRGFARTAAHVLRREGPGALFKGFTPIAMRQVPYTMVKLVCFEVGSTALLAAVAARRADRRVDSATRGAITWATGLCAGATAAIASQPADVLLTRLCGSSAASSLTECVVAEGPREMVAYLSSIGWRAAYSGLVPRLAMISAMSSVQFLLYDALRTQLLGDNLPGDPAPASSTLD